MIWTLRSYPSRTFFCCLCLMYLNTSIICLCFTKSQKPEYYLYFYLLFFFFIIIIMIILLKSQYEVVLTDKNMAFDPNVTTESAVKCRAWHEHSQWAKSWSILILTSNTFLSLVKQLAWNSSKPIVKILMILQISKCLNILTTISVPH